MRPFAAIGILLGVAVLGGCADTMETNQTWAIQECVHQSLRVQGFEFAETGQPDKEGDRLLWLQGDKLYERASFRFEPTAEFVIDYGDVMLPWPNKAYRLRCTGDFTTKVLTGVEVNGKAFSPKPGESWYFGSSSDSDNRFEEPAGEALGNTA